MTQIDIKNDQRVKEYLECPHYPTNHTFAICAHGQCEYLEENIRSLVEQTVPSNIIMCTSTPNEFLKALADQYDIPLFINKGCGDRMDNWNFAYAKANTDYVTLVFQDDKYRLDYCEKCFKKMKNCKNTILLYTDHLELKDDGLSRRTKNTIIKKVLNFPLNFSLFQTSKWIRNRILSFGNPICCHSTIYNKSIIGPHLFTSELIVALDWDMYYQLAAMKGSFIYLNQPVTFHRIHEGEQTTECIKNGLCYKEDLAMLNKFWPTPIARFIMKFYAKRMDIYKNIS